MYPIFYQPSYDGQEVDIDVARKFFRQNIAHFTTCVFGKGAPDAFLINDFSKNPELPICVGIIESSKKPSILVYQKTLEAYLTRLKGAQISDECLIKMLSMLLFSVIRFYVHQEYQMRESYLLVTTHKAFSEICRLCNLDTRVVEILRKETEGTTVSAYQQDASIIALLCMELGYKANDAKILDLCIKKVLVCNRQTFADDPEFIADIINTVSEPSSVLVS